jgi:hypothetical protein
MKKAIFTGVALCTLLLNSCGYVRLGDFTVLANGNMDSKTEYQKLSTNVTAVYKAKKDNPLEECVDKAVKTVNGGEFLKNVTVYVQKNGKKVKVVGDVYGIRPVDATGEIRN